MTQDQMLDIQAAAVALVTSLVVDDGKSHDELLRQLSADDTLPDNCEALLVAVMKHLGATVREYGPEALCSAGLSVARDRYRVE